MSVMRKSIHLHIKVLPLFDTFLSFLLLSGSIFSSMPPTNFIHNGRGKGRRVQASTVVIIF